jgi:hypothetical protein
VLISFWMLIAKAPRVLLGLLLIVAVAGVLITPDPADDIHAVLRQQEISGAPSSVFAPAAALARLSAVSLTLLFVHRRNLSSSVSPAAADLLRVFCTWRC